MTFKMVFLGLAMALTACGAAPTGRSTLPISEVTPLGTTANAKSANASPVADPTLPDKKVDLSAEGAFAANK